MSGHGQHPHQEHHRNMMADFKHRFRVSLVLTVPALPLSPMIQGWAVGINAQLLKRNLK